MTLDEQKAIASQLDYTILAGELARRNVARVKNRHQVVYACDCGWQGNATLSRQHKCAQKKLAKVS